MNYFVLTIDGSAATGNAVVTAHPAGMPIKNFEFARALPLAERFPVGARYAFSSDYPDLRNVCDLQSNTLGVFIVSAALRGLLSGEPSLEFLPIQLRDHRGGLASDSHSLANFLEPVDCVDVQKSQLDMSNTHAGRVDRIRSLSLDAARIPQKRKAFRLAQRTRTVIVDGELRDRIEAARLSGVIFVPVNEFDSALHLGV